MTLPFGNPELAPAPIAKPTILDRLLGRLFPTAQYTGLLDPASQQGLQHQARQQLAANLLVAGGRSPQNRGTLANIGAAIGGVDTNALADRALALQAARNQQATARRISQVAASTRDIKDPYQRVAAMVSELAGEPGTEDLVGKLSNVLAQLKPEKPVRPRYAWKQVVENGQPIIYRINEDDPSDRIRIGVAPATGMGSQNSIMAQETRAAAKNALAALNQADRVLARDPDADILPIAASIARGAERVPVVGSALSGLAEPIAQHQMSKTQKEFQQAMDQFLHNYSALLPRGGRSVQILRNLRASFAPSAGQNEKEVRAAFTRARADLRRTLEGLASGKDSGLSDVGLPDQEEEVDPTDFFKP